MFPVHFVKIVSQLIADEKGTRSWKKMWMWVLDAMEE